MEFMNVLVIFLLCVVLLQLHLGENWSQSIRSAKQTDGENIYLGSKLASCQKAYPLWAYSY